MAKRSIRIFLGGSRKPKGFYLTLLVVAVAAVALALLGAPSGKRALPPQRASLGTNALITIDFKGGAGTRTFEGDVTGTMTISDALAIAGAKGSFTVTMDEKGFLQAIDGRSGLWLVLQNNKRVKTPLTQTRLLPGDIVRVKPAGS